MSRGHSPLKSFPYAFNGIKIALRNEPNFRIHLIIAMLTLTVAVALRLGVLEFALLILTIGFVLILELINTVLEAMVDLVSPEVKLHAKIAKDVSAAAVLIAALLSVIVGFLLFLPKIIGLYQ
jgi:diacylglycerol kinase